MDPNNYDEGYYDEQYYEEGQNYYEDDQYYDENQEGYQESQDDQYYDENQDGYQNDEQYDANNYQNNSYNDQGYQYTANNYENNSYNNQGYQNNSYEGNSEGQNRVNNNVYHQPPVQREPQLPQTRIRSVYREPRKQPPNHLEKYSNLIDLLLSAMKVDKDVQEKVGNTIKQSPQLITRQCQIILTNKERENFTTMKKDIKEKLEKHKRAHNIVLLQTLFRGYLARKKYQKFRKIYVKGRNQPIHELISREIIYTKFMQQLCQKFAIPLLNTPDRILKDESADLKEFLKAIVDIESLHRGLLRKFKGFIDEGCDWPSVNGFGNIFLDLKQEFRAYGDYIRHFKYTLDMLDNLDINEEVRPRLVQFLEERGNDNVGFKALVTKPLNQIATYELGIQKMADSTSPDDSDFKVLMDALAIISETNKHINTSLNLSYNTAKIKKLERRLTIKPSKGQPDLDKLYTQLISKSEFSEEHQIEIFEKRGVKKNHIPGVIYFFNNMILLATVVDVRSKPFTWKTKRLYQIPFVKGEVLQGTSFQLVALQPPIGKESNSIQDSELESCKDIPNSVSRCRVDSQLTLNSILQKIETLKEQRKPNKVFGIDLITLIQRENNPIPVPMVIQTLCKYILDNFIETVGLFRVPGSAQTEKLIKNAYDDDGGGISISSFNLSAADAAGLIKLYFRDLPSPLCGELFIKFVETQKKYSREQIGDMLSELRYLVNLLPKDNKQTLGYMCKFMWEIAQHAEVNKMNCSNVAMCIGPDLMKPPVDSIELALMIPQANEALARLVEFYDRIFTN